MSIEPRFIDCVFDPRDLVEVRIIHPKDSTHSNKQFFSQVDQVTSLDTTLRQANSVGGHIYIGANPRKRQGGKAEDVALAQCVFVDIDDTTVDQARQQIVDAGLPTPTCLINSGHGVHAYWRLNETMADLPAWSAAQKKLIGILQSDKVIHDPPRVMRLPGYVNHKAPKADCRLLDADPQRRYDLSQLIPPDSGKQADPQQVADHWLQKALQRAGLHNCNNSGFWLACQLRDAGLDQGHAETVLESYADQQDGDYTTSEAVASIRSVYSRTAHEPAKAKTSNLANTEKSTISVADDPPVIPLNADVLPEISPDVLPYWAWDYVAALCNSKEVSPTMGCLLTLAILASCVQRKFKVQIEGSYYEPLCIYTAPSLESGERKTAIHGPLVRPLFDYQGTLREETSAEQKQAMTIRRLADLEIKVLERDYKKAPSDERESIIKKINKVKADMPPLQAPPQLIVEDFTEAALTIAMLYNDESLLVTSDEGGLFDNLSGRHSDTSEIDLFLKSHSGSPHTVNRVSRENILLRRPMLSVAISPQPGVLAKLANKEGFLTRGLTARFLWALPQSQVGARKLESATIDAEIVKVYSQNLVHLAKLSRQHDGNPLLLRLTEEAYETWKAFERELEPRIGPDGDLKPIKPWASKLSGAVARIAAVCHCGEHMENAGHNPIGEDQMLMAIQIGRELIPHSLAVHRLMGGEGWSAAQAVVEHYHGPYRSRR